MSDAVNGSFLTGVAVVAADADAVVVAVATYSESYIVMSLPSPEETLRKFSVSEVKGWVYTNVKQVLEVILVQ